MRLKMLLPLLFSFSSMTALAEGGGDSGSGLTFHGKLWTGFSYDLDAEDDNRALSFGVGKALLKGKYDFGKGWYSVLAVDAAGKIKLNEAYIGKKDLIMSDSFRLGMHPNFYLDGVYSKLGTQWLGKSLAESMGHYMLNDTGLSYTAMFSDMISFDLYLGDGMTADGGGHKTVVAPSLAVNLGAVSLLVSYKMGMGSYAAATESGKAATYVDKNRNLLAAAVVYNSDMVDVAAEIVQDDDKRTDSTFMHMGATVHAKLSGNYGLYLAFAKPDADYAPAAAYKEYKVTVGPTVSCEHGMKGALTVSLSKGDGDMMKQVGVSLAAEF